MPAVVRLAAQANNLHWTAAVVVVVLKRCDICAVVAFGHTYNNPPILQPSLRNGLEATIPFTNIVRGLKKL